MISDVIWYIEDYSPFKFTLLYSTQTILPWFTPSWHLVFCYCQPALAVQEVCCPGVGRLLWEQCFPGKQVFLVLGSAVARLLPAPAGGTVRPGHRLTCAAGELLLLTWALGIRFFSCTVPSGLTAWCSLDASLHGSWAHCPAAGQFRSIWSFASTENSRKQSLKKLQ